MKRVCGAILLCVFPCLSVSFGDSIVLDGKEYKDVYVSESASTYFVRIPQNGTVKSASKTRVNPTDVAIDSDEKARESLLDKWRKQNDAKTQTASEQADADEQQIRAEQMKQEARKQLEEAKVRAEKQLQEEARLQEQQERLQEQQERLRKESEARSIKEAEDRRKKEEEQTRAFMRDNKHSILEVKTDQRSFINRPFCTAGVISVSAYYNYGYQGAQGTHLAFEIQDGTGTAYAYVRRDRDIATPLRKILLDAGGVARGTFLLNIDTQRFQDAMDVHCELWQCFLSDK